MILITSDSLINGIQKAETQGFNTQFRYFDNKLIDWNTNKAYEAKEITIIWEERYEGNSNPSDSSMIFAIECIDGNKGYICSNFGIYANYDFFSFINSLNNNNQFAS